ncbi:prolyl oligopeptidase family serine peptidase [Adhaeribacter soli]|uniref:prolyl oligopeptidase n=1 Tax=Adhaeribacter soli TaxID=2607655 RepID=A0A5N1J4I1_9BACT|nr:prolyl oligopeptidase family serine peptidase [Adhaeribacter soli]KAA9345811.1 S9 family peptidase [Adhaeribacter soli]
MLKNLTYSLCIILSISAAHSQTIPYPVTEKAPVKDTYFNKFAVTDDYQWLENFNSPKVNNWVNAQNEIALPLLNKWQTKHNTFLLIDKYSFARFDHPKKHGKYYFTMAYNSTHGTPALYYKESFQVEPRLLVDPNVMDTDTRNKITIRNYAVSKNSEYLALQFNLNGSDWTEIKVVSLKNGAFKKDHLKGIKFSNIAWKNDGFFYSSFPQADNLSQTLGQKIYYHKIGTEQKDDQLIFERNNPKLNFRFNVTSDERFLIIKEINEEGGKINIFYLDYEAEQPALKPLLTNLRYGVQILDSHEGKLIALAAQKDKDGSILEIDPANPLKWRSIAPKFSKAVLEDVIPLKDKIIATYQANQRPLVSVFNYKGDILYNLELPLGTSVDGFSGNADDEEFLFHLTSYLFPPLVYSFNVNTYKLKVTDQTRVNYTIDDLEVKQIEAPAKDGVNIPMLLVHKKGLALNGNNPTILSAYGGFGALETPSFDPAIVYFVKQGGVFAFANIRGGGDLGVEWAIKGRGRNKQTSFNDFISSAEHLINAGYTSSSKLAATGASNGGLVVAAAAIQRPALFKAVVPVVAPLDMIRFEKFTAGRFWADEYGTASDSSEFRRLYKYSPYHNIQEEVNYPAMLIMTSDNDDRVVPLHSYKFAARLQNRPAQKNPILLRTEKKAGHQGANTMYSGVNEKANMYAFIWELLNQK